MHQEIADFPNRAFYGGRLHVVPLDHQVEALPKKGNSKNAIDNLLLTHRLCFVAAPTPEPIVSEKVNPIEARMIAATVERIYLLHADDFDAQKTVGVIVPYRNQIAAVRNAIDAYGHPALHDITIDTVERFQGSQRDYILYGFTVQRTYQLNFLSNNTFEEDGQLIDRKLNVVMTRARKHLLMFGNPEVICDDPVFEKLVRYVKAKDCWVDVDADCYRFCFEKSEKK
jgi:superfamily I DNA and/or RNA helicase